MAYCHTSVYAYHNNVMNFLIESDRGIWIIGLRERSCCSRYSRSKHHFLQIPHKSLVLKAHFRDSPNLFRNHNIPKIARYSYHPFAALDRRASTLLPYPQPQTTLFLPNSPIPLPSLYFLKDERRISTPSDRTRSLRPQYGAKWIFGGAKRQEEGKERALSIDASGVTFGVDDLAL